MQRSVHLLCSSLFVINRVEISTILARTEQKGLRHEKVFMSQNNDCYVIKCENLSRKLYRSWWISVLSYLSICSYCVLFNSRLGNMSHVGTFTHTRSSVFWKLSLFSLTWKLTWRCSASKSSDVLNINCGMMFIYWQKYAAMDKKYQDVVQDV